MRNCANFAQHLPRDESCNPGCAKARDAQDAQAAPRSCRAKTATSHLSLWWDVTGATHHVLVLVTLSPAPCRAPGEGRLQVST